MNATREQLLDAAERLFSEEGIDAVSLRDITAAAGANVAAVNYHFGSKDNLVREVFARRFAPLNEERLRLLEAFEARSRCGRASLEQVLFAFVHPVVRRMVDDPQTPRFMRLMAHVHTGSNRSFVGFLLDDMSDMIERFIDATQRAAPSLDRAELHWRGHFMMGVLLHTAAAEGLLEMFSGGRCRVKNAGELSRRLVAFMAGGFRADPARSAIAELEVPEEVKV
jgi:AcrR family transcriptional regulator